MKTLKDCNFSGKRVLLRVDYNVPLTENGDVLDDKRLNETLPTLNYLLNNKAKIILITHAGRPKGDKDEMLKLDGVAKKLSDLLGKQVKKLDNATGIDVQNAISSMNDGDIVMLENIRFYKGEKSKDEAERLAFAKELSLLGDCYVNDAFANCHRDHASMTGIPKYLDSFAGLLVEKEVKTIKENIAYPHHPFISIIGGAKADKLNAINNLLKTSDKILLGGSLAFLVLKASGKQVGSTKVDTEGLQSIATLIGNPKIIVPVDAIIADKFDNDAKRKVVDIDSIEEGWMALDIGPKTINLYQNILKNAKTIVWNGPMGVFEFSNFSSGTKSIAEVMANSIAITIVGGGDSAAAVEKFHLSDKMTLVSTGGGASLTLFEGKDLVALKALE